MSINTLSLEEIIENGKKLSIEYFLAYLQDNNKDVNIIHNHQTCVVFDGDTDMFTPTQRDTHSRCILMMELHGLPNCLSMCVLNKETGECLHMGIYKQLC